jgi:hypothetical protein
MSGPRDFERLGDHLQSAVPRLIRRRHRTRIVLATVLAFAALSGASIAGSPRVRDLLGIDDKYEVVEEGTVEGVPYARVIERDTGDEAAWVGEPEIRSGGDRYEEFLRWQRLMDRVLTASGTEPLPNNVCTEEELTDLEVITIQTYVDHSFRPGDDKASMKAHIAVERALGATEEVPCRGYGFAHSQVDLVFREAAPPSDLLPGARAAYEEAEDE